MGDESPTAMKVAPKHEKGAPQHNDASKKGNCKAMEPNDFSLEPGEDEESFHHVDLQVSLEEQMAKQQMKTVMVHVHKKVRAPQKGVSKWMNVLDDPGFICHLREFFVVASLKSCLAEKCPDTPLPEWVR